MKVIAVDPGETTGVAFWDSKKNWHWAEQFPTPEQAAEAALDLQFENPDYLIVEDYNAAGWLDKAGKETIKVLGMFQYAYGFTPVHPQARKAFVDKATEMVGLEAKNMYRNGRDAISALAHALAFEDSHGDD